MGSVVERRKTKLKKNTPILSAEGVYKHYGKFTALADVSMSIDKAEMRAIIGPNGAGKSTLLKVMSGEIRADRGRVFLKDVDVSKYSPYQIRRANVSRSFQRTQVMPGMTVIDNVKVAVQCFTPLRYSLWRSFKENEFLNQKANEILHLFGLAPYKNHLTGYLSYADQRKVDLAIAFAGEPALLLLDEPTAGMSAEEGQSFTLLISKLCDQKGITLIFVEHDMEIVFQIAHRITVLNYGRIILEASPEEVAKNQEVQQIYMGI